MLMLLTPLLSTHRFGLCVHFKIYPIIHGLAFLLFLRASASRDDSGSTLLHRWRQAIVFTLVSAGTFFALTGVFNAM
jgi:hypothetical protein